MILIKNDYYIYNRNKKYWPLIPRYIRSKISWGKVKNTRKDRDTQHTQKEEVK